MPPTKRDGIFCVEGEWSNSLTERRSVEPLLQVLDRLGIAKTIHRDVASRDELAFYLGKWQQQGYKDYKVLYVAAHGESGSINLGKDEVTLSDLRTLLAKRCAGKIVYFGSCLTLKTSEADLKEFAKVTRARAVVGYAKEIDWFESAAFELLLLQRMISGIRSDGLFNGLAREHGLFAKSLGLVVATKTNVYRTNAREPVS